MSIRVELSHDSQEIELLHNDGIEKLNIISAGRLASQIQSAILELDDRRQPPCPTPFPWENKELAKADACSGQKKASEMQCGGGVGGQEFYLKDFIELRDWINKVLEYHRNQNCLNLSNLEEIKL